MTDDDPLDTLRSVLDDHPVAIDYDGSQFGHSDRGLWWSNICFPDEWIHPDLPERLRDAGWFIEDGYVTDDGLIIRVEWQADTDVEADADD